MMENQDKRKTNTSGHGVHVCHKCGWAFPNPHPSAKHRRAHKRICGTTQGLIRVVDNAEEEEEEEKKTHLMMVKNASDEEDQHLKTPTLSRPETGGTSASQRSASRSSTRSDDDVFADAVTDFSDSSGSGEVFDDVKESLKVLRNLSGAMDSDPKMSGEDAAAGEVCSTNSSVDNSKQPLIMQLTNENDLAETATIANASVTTGRSEVATVDNMAASNMVSTERDVHVKEVENITTSAMMDTHPKGIEEVETSALLCVDANDSKEVITNKNDSERETLSLEAAAEVCGTVLVGEPVSVETSDSPAVDVMMETTRDDLESLSDSSAVVDKLTESHDKLTEEGNLNFHALKVPEDLRLREDLQFLADFKDHKPLKFRVSAIFDASQETELEFNEDAAVASSLQSDFQYKESAESIISAKHRFIEDVLSKDYIVRADNDKPVFDPVGGSSLESETKGEKISNKYETVQAPSASCSLEQNHLEWGSSSQNAVTPCAEGVHSVRDGVVLDNIDGSKSSSVIENGSCKVAAEEPHVAMVIAVSSETLHTAASHFNPTISSTKHGDTNGYENAGVEDVDSRRREMKAGEEERTDVSNAGIPSKCALISSASHDETGIQLELESVTEPLAQTACLLNDGDGAHEFGKAVASIVDSSIQEVKGGEEEDLREIKNQKLSEPAVITPESHGGRDGATDLQTHNMHIQAESISNYVALSNVLENPSHPKDLKDAPDDVEDRHSSEDKVVGVESVSPADTCDVLHKSTSCTHDVGSKSSNDPDPGLIPTMVGNHGKEVFGDAVGGILHSSAADGSCAKELADDISVVPDESQRAALDDDDYGARATDVLVDSSSQTDSLEANWGSNSVFSDVQASTDFGAIPSDEPQASAGKQTGIQNPSGSVVQQLDKPEIFETPSFMSLVDSKVRHAESKDASQTPELEVSSLPQSAWFPSIPQAANDSPGRTRNEEIIAKVTNWSTSEQQHTALKSLLGEAQDDIKDKPPSPKDVIPASKNGDQGTPGNVSLTSKQQSIIEAVKAAAGKEWDSPARYPTNIKRDKGKSRSRSYWSTFICCSSVHSS